MEGFYIEEVFLLLTGCVLRESSREARLGLPPHYMTEGSIFGERIFLDKELKYTYTAVCDSILLKITKQSFSQLMEENITFKEEILNLINERNRHREMVESKVARGESIETGPVSEKVYAKLQQTIKKLEIDNKIHSIK